MEFCSGCYGILILSFESRVNRVLNSNIYNVFHRSLRLWAQPAPHSTRAVAGTTTMRSFKMAHYHNAIHGMLRDASRQIAVLIFNNNIFNFMLFYIKKTFYTTKVFPKGVKCYS